MTGSAAIANSIAAKKALRKVLRERRDRVPPALAIEAAAAASTAALASPVFANTRLLAAYAAMRGELSTGPLVDALRTRGVRIAYPRVVTGTKLLEFCLADGDADLTPGTFGIPEPRPTTKSVALADIDTFLVPGLGFDRMGARLGWGQGFYDATLALAPHARLIGFGFAFQLVDHIPSDSHDLTLHDIITEQTVEATRFSAQT